MDVNYLEPRKALNKAFLRIKPHRDNIEIFKANFRQALDHVNIKESEEYHKNILADFFKKTYYDPEFYINTRDKKDLVIHTGKDAKSPVGVIIEAKSPKNATEMVTRENLNKKALQELVYYYMQERITRNNKELKHLIVTNTIEWFIFDAHHFNKLFAENVQFVKEFKTFEHKGSSASSTDFFYKSIAKPFIDTLPTIEYTYIDIRKFEKPLRNEDKTDDKELVPLYKIFSPEHLLKLSFANDSNSLDKNFYAELLHIIGLTETKEAGKKIIGRHKPGQRNTGSLLENAIIQLDSQDKLFRLTNLKQYGDTNEERLFNVALELTITWVNRILFLKLLEAQLKAYHPDNKDYSFLKRDTIHDYDDLNRLFFQVLAKRPEERNDDVRDIYKNVPYLNSSLFEPTEIEHQTLLISQLENNKTLPLLPQTVIKDHTGKKVTGNMNALHYFLEFLDAYDFSSEGSEDIQEDNKRLINASVLGLIFEKINGYRDGSFFTPGFITMYMCRETIRRAVVQRFNEIKGWNVNSLKDIVNKNPDLEEANYIVNSLRICDPAVGSGHFLVSALNEMIAIKHELRILCDRDGEILHRYGVEVVNDELIVTEPDGKLFQYNPVNNESRRIQEALFHEKETIIENCLFGVDINPNSVKICRLRLWIELLKNAYYKGPDYKELETLPNIDINIKTGNSLISRFPLDADLTKALGKTKIEVYKNAVVTYRNAESKEQKREMEQLINDIKGNFRSEIASNDPMKRRYEKLSGELKNLETQTWLFEPTKKELAERAKKITALAVEIKKLGAELEEIRNNKMYENAFEWRFEFPEVLDDDGNFVGFNAIIGNPPYIQLQKMAQAGADLQKMNYETYIKTGDIYSLFYELGFKVLKQNGLLSFITSNKWMRAAYGESLRRYFTEKSNPLILIDFGGVQVFDTATVDTNIFIGEKAPYLGSTNACVLDKNFSINNISEYIRQKSSSISFTSGSWVVLSSIEQQIKNKIEAVGKPLKDWDIQINYGIKTGYNEAFIIDTAKRNELIAKCAKSEEIIRPLLNGKDIKRYNYRWENSWIIFTRKGINIEKYPAVKNHLEKFYDKLKPRNNGETIGRKPGPYKWYEIQDNVAYFEDFEKSKIAWGNLALRSQFAQIPAGFYINAPSSIIATDNLYLLAVLNSKLGDYYIKQLGVSRSGGYMEYKPMFVQQLPIPEISKDEENQFNSIIEQILHNSKNYISYTELEKELNYKVYDLYNLTSEEISLIESM